MGFGLKKYNSDSYIFSGVLPRQLLLGAGATGVWYYFAQKYRFFRDHKSLLIATPIVGCLMFYYAGGICMHYFAAYHNLFNNIDKRKENLEEYHRLNPIKLN